MDYESKLGKLLLTFKVGVLHKGIAYLCVAMVVFFAAMIAIVAFLIDMTDMLDNFAAYDLSGQAPWLVRMILIALFATAAIIFAGWARRWLRLQTAHIYERGIVTIHGSRTNEIAYSQIRGILAISLTKVLITNGPSPNITTTGGRNGSITIAFHESPEKIVVFVPRFKQFAKALNTAYTQYIAKDLHSGNIHTADISFGDNLQLCGGEFIYTPAKDNKVNNEYKGNKVNNEYKGNKVCIGYSDILALKFSTPSFKFMELTGRMGKIEITHSQARDLLNIDVLYYIIKAMPGAVLSSEA